MGILACLRRALGCLNPQPEEANYMSSEFLMKEEPQKIRDTETKNTETKIKTESPTISMVRLLTGQPPYNACATNDNSS